VIGWHPLTLLSVERSVNSSVRLDGVLTLVDAKHVLPHLNEEKPKGEVNEALQQIAYADRLVLNKTDLVSPSTLEILLDTELLIMKHMLCSLRGASWHALIPMYEHSQNSRCGA
jgi:GTP-binding protein EngB required for normal cell division